MRPYVDSAASPSSRRFNFLNTIAMNSTAAPEETISATGPEYRAPVTPKNPGSIRAKGTLNTKSLRRDSSLEKPGHASVSLRPA